MRPFDGAELDRLAVSLVTAQLTSGPESSDVVRELVADAREMEHGLEGLIVAMMHIACTALEHSAAIGAATNSLTDLLRFAEIRPDLTERMTPMPDSAVELVQLLALAREQRRGEAP